MFKSSFSLFSISNIWRVATLFLCLAMLGACAGAGGTQGNKFAPKHEARISRTDTVMGTIAQMTFYGDDTVEQEVKERLTDDLMTSVHDLEDKTLSWKIEGSEVERINANAGVDGGVSVSRELEEVLAICMQLSKDSAGAFDITIGALSRLWNMDEVAAGKANAKVPDEKEIDWARAHAGYEKAMLTDDRIRLPEGMALDLGSVGKGYALDVIADRLKDGAPCFQGGVVALGGSIYVFGEKKDGTPWRVGIKDPADPSGIMGYLELKGEWFVSTSGDYERFFEAGGKRYSHILDPNTGYPAQSGLRSVTVLAKNGLLSDALSTACFVLGEDGAKQLAEQYGVSLFLVKEEGEVWYSEGLKGYLVFSSQKE